MPATLALRTVTAIRYAMPLREGGSLPAIVEADDDGLYVVKFRGAGQGSAALVAEVIAGELARALGLLVPELVWVEVDPVLAAAEPDAEIQELVGASGGRNVGLDFLPGALTYVPGGRFVPDPELAAAIVWFDAWLTNVDRTPRNPNLLLWHERLWLIDHGAALYLQHRGLNPAADAPRAFEAIAHHVLLRAAGPIEAAHEQLGGQVDRALLEAVVGLVPEEWFGRSEPGQYVEYLELRLENGGFVAEAEDARRRA